MPNEFADWSVKERESRLIDTVTFLQGDFPKMAVGLSTFEASDLDSTTSSSSEQAATSNSRAWWARISSIALTQAAERLFCKLV